MAEDVYKTSYFYKFEKQLLFDGIMSALLRKDLFRVPMRPISGTDEDRLRHR